MRVGFPCVRKSETYIRSSAKNFKACPLESKSASME